LAQATLERQAAYQDNLNAQNEIQARELELKKEKHEEELAKLRAKKAKLALEHANKIDAALLVQ
jgi:hypothetical protein